MAENEEVAPHFAVQRIYTKDVSFESPLGAGVFSKKWQPQLTVDLNSIHSSVGDDTHEVVLRVTVTGRLENDEVAFLVEVNQAGLFLIKGVDTETLRRTVGITGPTLLFPYAREALDNLIMKGGFPPVGLQPVNFEALYAQALQAKEGEAAH